MYNPFWSSYDFIVFIFFESETVFRCFNELLYIMTLPSLDSFFRNPSTGKLKDEIILVVDNGPSEQPSSPMVQMLLARLLKFLKLKKDCSSVIW